MTNVLRVNHEKKLLIMDRTFAKNAENTRSPEYAHLQNTRRDYPEYQVIRRTIKKNTKKNTYYGMTYDYMRDYIISHSPENNTTEVDEFDELILISRCQQRGKRYPAIKNWFLEKYPEIKEFGMPPKEEETEEDTELEDELPEEKAS